MRSLKQMGPSRIWPVSLIGEEIRRQMSRVERPFDDVRRPPSSSQEEKTQKFPTLLTPSSGAFHL